MRRLAFLCVAVAALLLPVSARAQRAADLLTSGTHVRVTPRNAERFDGTVQRLTMDTLEVAVSKGAVLVRFPTAQLERLEVSDGRDRARSAFIGGLAGTAALAILGAIITSRQAGGDSLAGFVGLVAGGATGGVLGAVTGALLAPEQWHDVRPLSFDR